MNIYLDIDGVLLANDKEAALHADEFLRAVLAKYPDSTYWLTTHDWRGENTVHEVLDPVLQPETIALLDRIKSTTWHTAKTEGIDFSQPFLWFDDDLYPEEQEDLEKHGMLDSHIMIDLSRNPDQLNTVRELL